MRNEVLTHEPSVVSRYHSLNNEARESDITFYLNISRWWVERASEG